MRLHLLHRRVRPAHGADTVPGLRPPDWRPGPHEDRLHHGGRRDGPLARGLHAAPGGQGRQAHLLQRGARQLGPGRAAAAPRLHVLRGRLRRDHSHAADLQPHRQPRLHVHHAAGARGKVCGGPLPQRLAAGGGDPQQQHGGPRGHAAQPPEDHQHGAPRRAQGGELLRGARLLEHGLRPARRELGEAEPADAEQLGGDHGGQVPHQHGEEPRQRAGALRPLGRRG
mmetsp:Transcript_35656/g.113295  ORF Transcript_35656/g.113295 Transcript_35656/m.113295 type:complete len:226 (+) Transcript_35656:1511-2188(+)